MRLTFTEVRPVADAGEGPGGGLILDHSEARRPKNFFCKVTPRVTPSRERRVRLQAASHQPRLFSYRANLLL